MCRRVIKYGIVSLGMVMLALVLLLASCQGPAGPAGINTGTVSGKVTNSLTNSPVSGVAITLDPAVKDVSITTDSSGAYSAQLPIGAYTLSFKKNNFDAATQNANIAAGQTTTKDVVLKPTKPVVVSAGTAQTTSPGATVTLTATAEALDGSTISGYEWKQTAGVPVKLDNATSASARVTLSDAEAYREALIEDLKLLERNTVQAINPHALSAAETTAFTVTVTTSNGAKYTATVNVVANLPYVVSTGLSDVPLGEPVLLNAKSQSGYRWEISAKPSANSTAVLHDDRTRNPSFVPDVVGKYTITERQSGANINVYVGTWAGGITGQNAQGRPLAAGCTVCHDGKTAANNFADWSKSGHAEIFTQNINDPAGHWAITCAGCHTVGYNPDVKNGGFDEAVAAEGWKVPPHGDKGLWTTILKDFPKTASMANIQCENCHGPNNGTGLHANKQAALALDVRVSLSADVCGSCHGEPPRHGRFQQWESSRHAGTDTTPARATASASCARCHSAQGFLIWLKQGDLTKQLQGANGNATVAELAAMGITADKAEPVTCAACHDPHAVGSVSSDPTNATGRVVDVTAILPAGFQAKDVGKGALCMTCHNTRNALHNIDAPPTSYSAPHVAAQTDVVMGENAYFVNTPQRSPHSLIKDTCVTCHMEATPPPEGYTQTGTNHSFKASLEICKECHSETLNAEALQVGVEDKLETLGKTIGTYVLNKLPAKVSIVDYTPHTYQNASVDVASAVLVVDKTNIVSLEPTEPHGQQGFIFKFKTPVTFNYPATAGAPAHSVTTSEAEVQFAGITTNGTTAVVPATDKVVQAGWNYFLIHGDKSEGIHNPAFINDVIDASIRALK